jgi:hypothetical protein
LNGPQEGHHVGVVQITARRASVVALVTLACGCAAGTAVAHDGPHWWTDHHGRGHGHGHGDDDTPTTATTTTTAATTTNTTNVSTSPTTTTTAPTAPPATTPQTPTTSATGLPAAAAPQLGHTVALQTGSGTVVVRPPDGPAIALTGDAQALPTGTRVDTRAGEVVLTSAVDAKGTTQTGRFTGGVFEVRQNGRYTQLVLVGGHWAACKTTASAASATLGARPAYVGARSLVIAKKKKPPIRRLWGSDDHGRFQTRGSGSVATVRGTRWLTEDDCAGTRTTVTKGAVSVRSRATGKTVTVSAGHSFLAKR